jgi:hypothetical protein
MANENVEQTDCQLRDTLREFDHQSLGVAHG